jgi:hypothetical protein
VSKEKKIEAAALLWFSKEHSVSQLLCRNTAEHKMKTLRLLLIQTIFWALSIGAPPNLPANKFKSDTQQDCFSRRAKNHETFADKGITATLVRSKMYKMAELSWVNLDKL